MVKFQKNYALDCFASVHAFALLWRNQKQQILTIIQESKVEIQIANAYSNRV